MEPVDCTGDDDCLANGGAPNVWPSVFSPWGCVAGAFTHSETGSSGFGNLSSQVSDDPIPFPKLEIL
jgi:hypothetical protein